MRLTDLFRALLLTDYSLLASTFSLSGFPTTTTTTTTATTKANIRVHGAKTRDIRLHKTYLSLSQRSEDQTANCSTPNIDRQSDIKYGRGISHISADLNEGDIIAYQHGTWYVDGTEVGDGSDSMVRYMQVDTIQLVWTHDCEHGVINGFDLMVAANDDDDDIVSSEESGVIVGKGCYFVINKDYYVQIGPEQVLARIPTTSSEQNWKDSDREMALSRAEFYPDEEIMTS
mmetsp:Transcript_22230/g.40074  ORF Transcript_22230/g.40074 Transcript_22230/m.40074 type:complete len:230 (+) Transcript_22230:34-723(+)